MRRDDVLDHDGIRSDFDLRGPQGPLLRVPGMGLCFRVKVPNGG